MNTPDELEIAAVMRRCLHGVDAHILAEGVVSSRGLHYLDRLIRQDDQWRIADRGHRPLWQFDNPAVASAIPGLSQADLKRGTP